MSNNPQPNPRPHTPNNPPSPVPSNPSKVIPLVPRPKPAA